MSPHAAPLIKYRNPNAEQRRAGVVKNVIFESVAMGVIESDGPFFHFRSRLTDVTTRPFSNIEELKKHIERKE